MSDQTITIPPRYGKRQAFCEWCLENAPTFASRMVHVPHRPPPRYTTLAKVLLERAKR